jgi:hypothetical protein
MVSTLPELATSFFAFCFLPRNKHDVLRMLEDYKRTLPFIAKLAKAIGSGVYERITVAAAAGFLPVVKYLHEVCRESGSVVEAAAQHGHLDCLQYAVEQGIPWNQAMLEDAAAMGGNFECLLYALRLSDTKRAQGPESPTVCAAAAKFGHFNCLKLAHMHGRPLTHVFTAALIEGHFDCLQYAVENGHRVDYHDCRITARLGFTSCTAYLYQQLLKRGSLPPIYARDLCREAAMYGSLGCLQALHEAACHWDEEITLTAAEGGHTDCLEYALHHGCPLGADVAWRTARMGSVEILRLIHAAGAPFSTEETLVAAERGHLPCLQYLHSAGCPWDAGAIAGAVCNGQLDCLRFLHEHGCPWNATSCKIASQRGQLACLQYMHEHGCPWDARTCISAATRDCYLYAATHGCPGAVEAHWYCSEVEVMLAALSTV